MVTTRFFASILYEQLVIIGQIIRLIDSRDSNIEVTTRLRLLFLESVNCRIELLNGLKVIGILKIMFRGIYNVRILRAQ